MKVLMISDLETAGGAAVAATRLAEALLKQDNEVIRIVSKQDLKFPPWQRIVPPRPRPLSARLRVEARLLDWPGFYRKQQHDWLRHTISKLRPDVINLHNLHGARDLGWDWGIAGVCAAMAPTLWTLHDAWSFTGRCAYMYDCRQFEAGCSALCPTASEYPSLPAEKIAPAWKERQRAYQSYPGLTVVSPSKWLAETAKQGLWRDHPVEVIPYGLPIDRFELLDRRMAREALAIPSDRPVLLIAAQNWEERRKGGLYLCEALQRLNTPIHLVVMGEGQLPQLGAHVRLQMLGYIDHERTKVLAYNAADLFVHPAPVDNLPNVVLESLACGTPVAGFPVGGVPDMVRPGISGWLASELSANALSNTLAAALQAIMDKTDLRLSCRELAQTDYDAPLQAKRYVELFQSRIARFQPS
jgi:glycosyltransferase involved in cell wall biosynthesis